MQRKKSILSFFQKPPAAVNQNAPLPSGDISSDSSEIRGTDTPPEKVPRQILPGSFPASDVSKGQSLFSSIMHKFVKADPKGKPQQERVVELKELFKQGSNLENPEKHIAFRSNDDDDVPGPDTPGTRPVVLRFKRVCEDIPKLGDEKKARILQEPMEFSRSNVGTSELSRKFEWLDPLWIKDAKGRRPGDPLYDKNTLYIPPDVLKKMSASQKQYWSVKSKYMDVVLFFKVGKFYELYELDAEIGHKELDWKMTLSGVGKCRQVGISESGIDDAVEKLVARGYKVGRIEQLETSDQAKARGTNSVIPRKLVQVVTPSTAISGNIGPDALHLLAIKEGSYQMDNGASSYGFAFVDCSTQQFWIGSIIDDASCPALGALLMQVSPREVIYESSGLSKVAVKALKKYSLSGSTATQLTPVLPATDFVDASEVRKLIHLKGYFRRSASPWSNALDNVTDPDVALSALGALIGHLSRLMLGDTLHGGDILPYHVYMGCLRMDGQTLVNLEIFTNTADGGTAGTLFKYLDNCVTSSGKRVLRRWICHPLKHVEGINNRLNVVEALMAQSEIMLVIAQHLRKLPDLERMLGRLKANFQSTDILVLPLIGKKILKQRVKVFGSLLKGLRIGIDLLLLLCKEGQLIELLLKIFVLPELNSDVGIVQLLVQLEAAVDSEFPNYQNQDVSGSEAETLSVLVELFMEKAKQWSQVIQAISCIDVLRSFAMTASMSCGAMSRPIVLPQSKTKASGPERVGPLLKIKGLWHPFALGQNGGLPVPNDLFLGEDSDGNRPHSLLLTGPNMGGKSTLLRATCLAVILAQLGCFVPSERCVLSLVDVIFTRLGATDRIMTGESTFLVECTETASVLQNASQDSLIILDELGRGTSTFDGYAIAYAVFRHLVERINCRLLFATHYHPLTKEFACHPHVMMQHMACAFKLKSEGCCSTEYQDLVFLYRLNDGPCPESYGLQVALMAGIPEKVVEAASQAGQEMKRSIGKCFKSSEHRTEFSTLHEEWLRALVNISELDADNLDDDTHDTLVCLWHELKASYQSRK